MSPMPSEEAILRLKEHCEKRRKQSLETPTQWPPASHPTVTAQYGGYQLAVINGFGGPCGYIALPPGHMYHGAWYDDIPIEVHGGWTFCQLGTDGNFWIGFDTAHYNSGHWTTDDVMAELHRAVDEIKEAK